MAAIQKALAMVNRAVQLDQQGVYTEAVPAYMSAVAEIEAAIAQEPNAETKAMLAVKAREYTARQREIVMSMTRAAAAPAPATLTTCGTSVVESPRRVSSATASVLDTRAALGLRHPESLGSSEAWRVAGEVAARAREEDAGKHYAQAFALYECSLDYFARAAACDDGVLTTDMRAHVNEQMRAYLSRAEQLKPFVAATAANAQLPQYQLYQQQQQQVQATAAVQQTALPGGVTSTAVALPGMTSAAVSSAAVLSATAVASATGNCTSCGMPLGQQSLYALNAEWHPHCFIQNVRCAMCHEQFDPAELKFVVREGSAYHSKCHDFTTGTAREVERTFFDKQGTMFLKASIARRLFHRGEIVDVEIVMDNNSHVPINSVQVKLFLTEVRRQRVGLEVKENAIEKKIGKVSSQLAGKLPLEYGMFAGKVQYQVPEGLPLSLTNDSAHILEYKMQVKFELGKLRVDTRFDFPVTIA